MHDPLAAEHFDRLARQHLRSGDLPAARRAYLQACRVGDTSLLRRLRLLRVRVRLRFWQAVGRRLGRLLARRVWLRRPVVLRLLVHARSRSRTLPAARWLVAAAAKARPGDATTARLHERVLAADEPGRRGGSRPGRRLDEQRRMLADFLYFGYIPSPVQAEGTARWYADLLADDDVPVFDPTSVGSMRDLLTTVVSDAIASRPSDRYLIGVSSGYDSRLLLAALLDLLPREAVTCFTSGHPGSADYDLAPRYTEGLVDEHHLLDVTGAVAPSLELWEEQVRAMPPTMPRAVRLPTRRPPGQVGPRWTLPRLHGFLGSVAGSRLKGPPSEGFDEAKRASVRRDARFVKRRYQETFLPPGYDPVDSLGDVPFLPPHVLSFDDQLDLFYRQGQLTRTLSSFQFTDEELALTPPDPRRRLRTMRDRTLVPFTDPRWQRSFLITPVEQRLEQVLLLTFARECYPHVFRELADPDDPRFQVDHQGGVHSGWLYFWERDEGFRSLIWAVLASLRERRLWFDPLDAVQFADRGEPHFGVLLQGLVSLELNIRDGKLPAP